MADARQVLLVSGEREEYLGAPVSNEQNCIPRLIRRTDQEGPGVARKQHFAIGITEYWKGVTGIDGVCMSATYR